jgi:hypothetical protein
MFGTIYNMRPKPGQEQAVAELHRRWERERRPKVNGMVAAYAFKPRRNLDQLMGVVVFDCEAHYYQNADDPEQDRWYRQLRELLEADPEWIDGDVLVAL